VHEQRVDRWLSATGLRHCDLVVLDPPESGAGEKVLTRAVRLAPRRIVYVSCGPASLGRDVAILGRLGYSLESLRAFDQFPMTHHVECVASFAPAAQDSGGAMIS
jgi:tRNA/tmRNA/rRNA uracil-C5-methylase (TrmA/RlmC/RlmD family)